MYMKEVIMNVLTVNKKRENSVVYKTMQDRIEHNFLEEYSIGRDRAGYDTKGLEKKGQGITCQHSNFRINIRTHSDDKISFERRKGAVRVQGAGVCDDLYLEGSYYFWLHWLEHYLIQKMSWQK